VARVEIRRDQLIVELNQTEAANGSQQENTRACLQLSKMVMAASWTPARKFLASLS
jgi:hypothetical protein